MTEHPFRLDRSRAALALEACASAARASSLRQQFSQDPDRFKRFSCSADGILLDYSKQRIDAATMTALFELAEESGLRTGIDAMLTGAHVNSTEDRPALHCAARLFEHTPPEARAESAKTLSQLQTFVRKIHSGALAGSTGKPIMHVVHIGIGGSDLGPRLVYEALIPSVTLKLRVSFAANVDETEIRSILDNANPAETLFIVASKSFSTIETLSNAHLARQWLVEGLGEQAGLSHHFVAISNNTAAARQFGIAEHAIFAMPEWIGGRFSVWSAIGLPLMLAFGTEVFDEFLAGGRSMDTHFANVPFQSNLPVILGLLGIWNASFLEIGSHAVLAYSHRLRNLPAHLQQLEMESNGKSVDKNGRSVSWQTAPILFGGTGTVGQHAYHQLFYQGTRQVALDFVLPVESGHSPAARNLLNNALAQSAALMLGRSLDEAQRELAAGGHPESEVIRLAPHLVCPGNQPSSTLLMPPVNAFSVGQLLALFEHKVFVQGWIWGINCFDQYGVELGKNMARSMPTRTGAQQDSSTAGLLAAIESMSETH